MEKDKLLLARVADKIKQYRKYGTVTFTSFLDPAEQVEAACILRDVPYVFFGGYDDAERKIIAIGATDINECADELSVIRITSQKALSHRSVLGSLVGLGISRDKLGDIIVNGETCNAFLQKSVVNFVLNNLDYVGREKVKAEEIFLSDVIIPPKNEKEIFATIASLRLDAVLSASLGISREKSCALLESERVNVNYKPVTSVNKKLCEGDLISARGYGRVKLSEVLGESKSGRIKIKVKKFI